MLVNQTDVTRNRRQATLLAAILALATILLAVFVSPKWLFAALAVPGLFWWWRRETKRRWAAIQRPFPEPWRAALTRYVDFYNTLDNPGRKRFENLMQVFLDEVAITGVRTDVDTTTQALVGASAVIPIFGFDDWEYAGLGEVLIYPSSFDDQYKTEPSGTSGTDLPRTLGMVGLRHLSGVMILSKPSLIAGFKNSKDKRNVGIHEFAHLVDKADGDVDGIPAGIPARTYNPWVQWVGQQLRSEGEPNDHIDDYAYTNEAEYFAVLSEYFFEAPATLQKKNPKLYKMLEQIYRQNPRRRFRGFKRRKRRVGRNDPCPCSSGEKFKRCCRRRQVQGSPAIPSLASHGIDTLPRSIDLDPSGGAAPRERPVFDGKTDPRETGG